MTMVLRKAWAGVDVGKTHHWICVINADGEVVLSVKIGNDEAQIAAVITKVNRLAEDVVWAVDIIGAPSALLLALLTQAGRRCATPPGGSCRR